MRRISRKERQGEKTQRFPGALFTLRLCVK